MKIVPVDQIPSVMEEMPLDNLMELYKLCKKMEVLCLVNSGIGLSAVQVGVPWKLFLVKRTENSKFATSDNFGYFLNCEYAPEGDEMMPSLEGCLSIKREDGSSRVFNVKRYVSVRVKGQRLVDKSGRLELEDVDIVLHARDGIEVVVFQHEIDHHNGILISDNNQELVLWKRGAKNGADSKSGE